MQEGYLCPTVFLCLVFAYRAGIYRHQVRKKANSPNVFQALMLHARAYALSRLNRKLLWAFLTLGGIHVAIGLMFIYDGAGRGEFMSLTLPMSLIQGALVVPVPDIPLDPFRVCMYDHNNALGVAFEVSVLVFGMSPTVDPRSEPHSRSSLQTRPRSFRWLLRS